MLQTIVIMLKGISSIIRRINIDTLDLPCKILLKGLQCKEVVTVNKHVISIPITEGLFSILNQYPRLQPRLILLAYPSKFKFGGGLQSNVLLVHRLLH